MLKRTVICTLRLRWGLARVRYYVRRGIPQAPEILTDNEWIRTENEAVRFAMLRHFSETAIEPEPIKPEAWVAAWTRAVSHYSKMGRQKVLTPQQFRRSFRAVVRRIKASERACKTTTT